MTRTTLGLVGACALGFAALAVGRHAGSACPDDKKPSLSELSAAACPDDKKPSLSELAEAACPDKKPTFCALALLAAACPDDKKPSLA